MFLYQVEHCEARLKPQLKDSSIVSLSTGCCLGTVAVVKIVSIDGGVIGGESRECFMLNYGQSKHKINTALFYGIT